MNNEELLEIAARGLVKTVEAHERRIEKLVTDRRILRYALRDICCHIDPDMEHMKRRSRVALERTREEGDDA
jgi:hypothetical protein